MKKGMKIGLGAVAFLAGALVLTGCTNSFCSKKDKAHLLFAFDRGVTNYCDSTENASEEDKLLIETATNNPGDYVVYDVNAQVKGVATISQDSYLYSLIANAEKNYYSVPTLNYFVEFDKKVLNLAIDAANADGASYTLADITAEQIGGDNIIADNETFVPGILDEYGYLKFYEASSTKAEDKIWHKWGIINNEIRTEAVVGIDECPTSDFVKFYQSQMNTRVNNSRACIALKDGYYGHYGTANDKTKVLITGKNWGYAWKTGFLSGLLVYPIGAAIDWLTSSMLPGVGHGWAQLLAILIVTVVVRGLMLAVTFKQTTASSKMQALQPEVAKIQAKYPNANTNNYEKQKLAEETQKLYKKNGINPFGSILIMLIQFPIFICVWGAMQGSAWLSTDAVLGLHLSDSISSVLTTWSNWRNAGETGVITALVLFLLMSGAQVVSMLLPQWLQKNKMKKVQKLGKNPAQKENNNRMKWFTYIMMIMIIIMGFSLASAMGVYWLIGALISITQTLITTYVMDHKKKNGEPKRR